MGLTPGVIIHLGCSENTQKACKSLAFGRVLPTSRVGYHASNIESVVWRHVTMVALLLDDNKTNDDGDGKENGKK